MWDLGPNGQAVVPQHPRHPLTDRRVTRRRGPAHVLRGGLPVRARPAPPPCRERATGNGFVGRQTRDLIDPAAREGLPTGADDPRHPVG